MHAAIKAGAFHATTPTPVYFFENKYAMPADWLDNAQQTNSIIVGGRTLLIGCWGA